MRGQDGQSEIEPPDHSASLGDSITSSTRIRFSVHTTAILNQQFYPAFRRSKRGLPKDRWGKPFFFESFRQGGNCNPCSLTSFFYFGGPQACACRLIYQIPEHYCRGLISRQAGLAQHLQRVIGLRKIRVVAHRLLAGCPHKGRRSIRHSAPTTNG